MSALLKPWVVKAYGGYWDILSEDGDIIACEIPYGGYADRIVELHNKSIE